MLLLGMDTATSAITVAVSDGSTPPVVGAHVDARAHAERLAPLIADVLARSGRTPADLTGIAVGVGPGPFTGLRVGMVTAMTMGHALGIPVYGVCSLDIVAHDAAVSVEGELLVATDARRKEVYWARYVSESGHARRLTDPAVDRPGDLPEDVRGGPAAGRGPLLYPRLFPRPIAPLDADAGALVRLAPARIRAGARMAVEPLYLRRPDALTTAERAAR